MLRLLAQLTCVLNGVLGGDAALEGLIRIAHRIVVMRVRLCHLGITAIEELLRIFALMTIMMIVHVSAHIRLIVVQIDGFRLLVVTRPVTVVIRRRPGHIRRTAEDIPERRALDEHRTNDIVRSVQPAVTDDLHIERVRTMLRYKRRYILIERRTETSLDEEGMVHAAMRLNHAQVVNPSVAVEVEVVDHIPTGVEQLLELRYRTRLSESRSYRIEVEVEREVGIVIGDCHRSDRRGLRRRRCDGRGIDGLRRHYRLYGRRYREDRRPATRHHQRGQY